MSKLTVLTPVDLATIPSGETDLNDTTVSRKDQSKDEMDMFNHPRKRRAMILAELVQRQSKTILSDLDVRVVPSSSVVSAEEWVQMYNPVHSSGLLEFLSTGWERWNALGEEGQSPGYFLEGKAQERLLIPGNTILPREPYQRPSQSVVGQIGYYCTDVVTPIFPDLFDELRMDATMIQMAVQSVSNENTCYIQVTHPGHHAARDSFGGYCYVNHVAAIAKMMSQEKVAILDVDYHVGNGTASIFYSDPSVFVVSIHCNPDYEYPFHSGFKDQRGEGAGEGTTLHLPLQPGTTWNTYSSALQQGLDAIMDYGATALIVSLGLDTHEKDPVTMRRAGFALKGDDYCSMGAMIAAATKEHNIPVIFLQEGGYRMDKVASAAANVLTSFCEMKSQR